MHLLSNSHLPQRTCVGCRAIRPSTDLVRVVCDTTGNLVISRTAHGRGAWVCALDQKAIVACLRSGLERGGFSRAFRRSINVGSADSAIEFIQQTSLI